MTRTAVWTTIAQTLTAEIAGGQYRPGDRLPTEADLARRFGVNRHTVRRALSELQGQGLTHARRGAGVFVSARPTEYPLGRRVRFHQTLRAAGQMPDKRILRRETRRPNAGEQQLLDLADGDEVHVYEGLSSADGVPIALFRSVFPAGRLPGLLDRLDATGSVTEALAAEGIADYTRASTRVTAKLATATQAGLLRISPGDPVLRTDSVNVDPEGRPIEIGRTWFAADRVSLTVAPD
ncbi:phosphonate metabolism transcriptional regulator PhnF [Tranquillimonas rosea]|uniref:phosphonate metabolism transcriptional regulator PhnF n=1 Tax=Tranquillimonas rosea TaxID=641238 RepID=UPI003BAC3D59